MRAAFEKVPGRRDMSWYFYVRRAEDFPFGWHYHIRCAAPSRRFVDSEESVTSVAWACGYQNIANFNRRFRERFGTSPRQYRTAHQP